MFISRSCNRLSTSPVVYLAALVTFLFSTGVVRAQHDASGGTPAGMVGGSVSGSTGRTSSKPASASSVPRRRAPAPARKPPVRGFSADYYNRQGDEFYKANNYKDALEAYLKAVDLNPNLATAQYRIGWIYNEREEYDDALEPLKRATALQA